MSKHAPDRMTGGKLTWVRWIDSTSHSGWRDSEEIVKTVKAEADMECESVGWVIHESKKSVSMAQNRSALKMMSDVIRIPKCAILERCDIEG